MTQHQNTLERFYSLDVLRGLAAISVVFQHWQHFFFSGTNPGAFDVTRLPLSEWIFFLYTKGWLAVDLFFSLSGFVFYWLYSKRIAAGTITTGKFALFRFSRLYPLHFVTLLVVALIQGWLMTTKGSYFVYPNNDGKHFLLNLFFASSWGVESGYSFNGPVWSVSVEVLLYAIFFICCRLLPIRAAVLSLISLSGFFIIHQFFPLIGRGVGSFFLGGCVFLLYQRIVNSRYATAATKWAPYLMVSAWAGTMAVILFHLDIASIFAHSSFRGHLDKILLAWPAIVLFPLTILSLALIETSRGTLGKRLSFVGNISYSSYLLQFPLQLLFSIAVTQFAITDSIYCL